MNTSNNILTKACATCSYYYEGTCLNENRCYGASIEQLKAECEYRKKQYDNQVAENTRLHIEYDKAFERLKAQQREIDALKDENEELEENLDMLIKEQKGDYSKLQEEFANYQTASDKEIEQLKSENERLTDKLADVLMCIESTTEIDVSKLVKQAKIDVLNELKEKIHDTRLNDDTAEIIIEMIEELKKCQR